MEWIFGGNFTNPSSRRVALEELSVSEPINDITLASKWLKRIGIAKEQLEQILAAPKQIADLAQRVVDLEKKLARCPGEGCPKCGELEYRVQEVHQPHSGLRHAGARVHVKRCGACGFQDEETVLAKRGS